ncbi:sortase [Streptomyces sp. NPDC090127]|uniref:sortase n=1 Tax=Streptomyces sp. NPDC090127 TaxID=3365953 RepID=UPI00382F56B8
MRPARTVLQVALMAAALTLSAPTALAADGGAAEATRDVSVSPRNAAPGTTVTVSTSACGKETYGKGESEAGGTFHLLAGDRKGVLVGEFTVPRNATSGTDTVTLKCPPRTRLTASYQIAGRPNGAVDAGFGGAAARGTELGLGWLLLGAAVAGGAIRMHRRTATARPRA